jgi:hypothetical protein
MVRPVGSVISAKSTKTAKSETAHGATDSEFLEDAADNWRFGIIDTTFAAHGFAGSVKFPHHVITEAKAPSRLAVTHAAFEAAPGFLREVLEEQGVHGAFETDMQFADLAL